MMEADASQVGSAALVCKPGHAGSKFDEVTADWGKASNSDKQV